jgi:hypothetical protein
VWSSTSTPPSSSLRDAYVNSGTLSVFLLFLPVGDLKAAGTFS